MIKREIFKQANHIYDKKDYKKAAELYRKAINKNDVINIKAIYNLGVCLIKLKQYSEAIHELEKAIKLDSTKSKYYFNLGYCCFILGNNKKALRSFNRAWALDETDKDCKKAINLILNKGRIK